MCKMAHFGNCDPETADQEYCIFHKPNKSEEEAVEFYRKFLERFKPRIEEIEVDGEKVKRLVFEEPVDARGFVFPEIPDVPIEYTDAEGNEWNQRFTFERAIFENVCNFLKTSFDGDFAFIGSGFREIVIFSNSIIKSISFDVSKFYKSAYFNNSRIGKISCINARFTDVHFLKL